MEDALGKESKLESSLILSLGTVFYVLCVVGTGYFRLVKRGRDYPG